MRVFLSGVLALATMGSAAGAPAPGDAAAAVLAANRLAVGEPPPDSAVTLTYRHVAAGLTGTLVDRVDLATGAFVESEEASGVADGAGFDGRTPWQRDISGAFTPQEGGDRIPVAISAAYRHANLWWRADRGGAAIAYRGRELIGGRNLDHLAVTPKGGRPFEAWFDGDSHLLARIAYDKQFLHVTETYSDYRREGLQVRAHAVTIDPGLGEASLARSTLISAEYAPAPPLATYAMPTTAPTGAEIADGAASTTVPFRLLNNHVYVEARVNGKGPFTFIVDTGGHTLLSPHLVEAADMKTIGEAVVSGAGEARATTGFVHFDEIAIGGVRLRDQIGFATNIYDKAIEGIAVDGMVGFELIRRMVTTIDYGRHTITFTAPDRFAPQPELGTAMRFLFYDHMPMVAGRIGNLPARFDIDTGSRAELDVTSPYVAAHDLRARFGQGATVMTGWGVGGPTRSQVVRLPSVTLGGVSVADPVADLSSDRGGSFSDPSYDGNVGSALLKRFVVTFDYAHRVLYLRRIEPVPPDTGTFDRSGLWINAHGDGYEVMDVSAGSAAADAGLRRGDLITAIDGRPATDAGLSDARQALRAAPPGTRVALAVQRGPETRSVTLLLRDQI